MHIFTKLLYVCIWHTHLTYNYVYYMNFILTLMYMLLGLERYEPLVCWALSSLIIKYYNVNDVILSHTTIHFDGYFPTLSPYQNIQLCNGILIIIIEALPVFYCRRIFLLDSLDIRQRMNSKKKYLRFFGENN